MFFSSAAGVTETEQAHVISTFSSSSAAAVRLLSSRCCGWTVCLTSDSGSASCLTLGGSAHQTQQLAVSQMIIGDVLTLIMVAPLNKGIKNKM